MKSNTKSERLCQNGKQLLIQAEIALFWQSPLKLGKVLEHIRNFLKIYIYLFIIFTSQTTDLWNLVTCALWKTVGVIGINSKYQTVFESVWNNNFESVGNYKIYCEWKRSATSTACMAVSLPCHGTVWVRVSLTPAPGILSPSVQRNSVLPVLSPRPGVWAAQGGTCAW